MKILQQFKSAKKLCRRVVAGVALVSVLATPFAAVAENDPKFMQSLHKMSRGKVFAIIDSSKVIEETQKLRGAHPEKLSPTQKRVKEKKIAKKIAALFHGAMIDAGISRLYVNEFKSHVADNPMSYYNGALHVRAAAAFPMHSASFIYLPHPENITKPTEADKNFFQKMIGLESYKMSDGMARNLLKGAAFHEASHTAVTNIRDIPRYVRLGRYDKAFESHQETEIQADRDAAKELVLTGDFQAYKDFRAARAMFLLQTGNDTYPSLNEMSRMASKYDMPGAREPQMSPKEEALCLKLIKSLVDNIAQEHPAHCLAKVGGKEPSVEHTIKALRFAKKEGLFSLESEEKLADDFITQYDYLRMREKQGDPAPKPKRRVTMTLKRSAYKKIL